MRSWLGAARALEPDVLIGAVIENQLGDYAQATAVSLAEEHLEVTKRAICRVNASVVGNVVSVVLPGRRTEWQNPNCGNAQILNVVELLRQAGKVAHSVVDRVIE